MEVSGIYLLLRGLDQPQQVALSRRAVLLFGLESAHRKHYLRSEAEEAEATQQSISNRFYWSVRRAHMEPDPPLSGGRVRTNLDPLVEAAFVARPTMQSIHSYGHAVQESIPV